MSNRKKAATALKCRLKYDLKLFAFLSEGCFGQLKVFQHPLTFAWQRYPTDQDGMLKFAGRAGPGYSIADIACKPTSKGFRQEYEA
jgi:hypothetical protein